MKEIFELICENSKVQSILQRGLVDQPVQALEHHRFGSVAPPKIDKISGKTSSDAGKKLFEKAKNNSRIIVDANV